MTDAHNIAARLRCPLGGIRNIAADFIVEREKYVESLESKLEFQTQALADCKAQLDEARGVVS